ncbi:hypothetical protein [Streptomyces sp. NPDC051561]|uniref:hypothetical protein n=1 Tax=Streptomyces sp. NPDC051561 TaxID=3365658 RepID=UPI00378DE0D6
MRGIPGLRIDRTAADGRRLRLRMVQDPEQTELTLVLPGEVEEDWVDIEGRHRRWCEDNTLRPLWANGQLDAVEADYLGAYPLLERSRSNRAAVGSGLLRRSALFHTVATFYRVQIWDDGDSWKIDARTASPRASGHDRFVDRLCHPRWGLPVHLAHRFCWCAPEGAPYQWDHTCAFYFGHAPDDGPLYLRVHASPEGYDYRRQVATLRKAGASMRWMARALPRQAVQQYEELWRESNR